MAGFLDPYAFSIEAEYARYINPDSLGKILFKNFAVNILGIKKERVRTPLSRHGDLGTYKDLTDVGIDYKNRSYNVETKIANWCVQKRNKINPIARWAFSDLHRGRYDLVFCVGINAPGLEDSFGYWRHFESLRKVAKKEGRDFGLSAWPHEREFLTHCGLFILPRQFAFGHCVNSPYVTVQAISQKYVEFFAWGYDIPRLRKVWHHAIQVVNSQPVDSQVDFPSAVGATSL